MDYEMKTNKYGTLCDLKTGSSIRPATEGEWRASREAELSNVGGGNGAIEVDGRTVYVEGGPELSDLKAGMRVEGGEGEDYDTGIIDSIDHSTGMATVRWDSLVVTPAPLKLLKKIKQ